MGTATNDRTPLTPLEWLMPRGYIRQILAFPAGDPSAVPAALQQGLRGLAAHVPYLLSRVISSDSPAGSVALTAEPKQSCDDLFSWHDASSTLDYAELRGAHFPISALSAPELVPADTGTAGAPLPEPAPVFRARLTLARGGGCFLCVAVHHSTADITGFGALLKLWAAQCRTGSLAAAGFDRTWLDRAPLRVVASKKASPSARVPGLLHVRGGPGGKAAAAKTTKSADPVPAEEEEEEELTTGVFFFPQRGLDELQATIERHIADHGPEGGRSTTHDALTALLWSAVHEAETSPSDPGPDYPKIGVPVNVRARVHPPLPRDYLGAAFVMASPVTARRYLDGFASTRPTGDNSEQPPPPDNVECVARVAIGVNMAVREVNGAMVQHTLAYLAAQPDVRAVALGERRDGGSISIVSWAQQQAVYELDWGASLGQCEAVRLPKLARRRDPVVLPRIPASGEREGGFEVLVSFGKEIFARFQKAAAISQFAVLRSAA